MTVLAREMQNVEFAQGITHRANYRQGVHACYAGENGNSRRLYALIVLALWSAS